MSRLINYTVTVVDSLSGDERRVNVKAFNLIHAQLIMLDKLNSYEIISSISEDVSRGTMKGE